MPYRIRLFASAREAVGAKEVEIENAGINTLAELLEQLKARWPALAPMVDSCVLAVNGEYRNLAEAVQERDDIALIPPISGGEQG